MKSSHEFFLRYALRHLALILLLAAPTALAQNSPSYEPSFVPLRDTLHVLDSTYIEVRLDRQRIYQHFRDGRVEEYLCSTGNPRIKDGIATREGIFTVQWRSRRHLSSQFGVYLNYWMPFDGGIGFHGLDGRSYYRYLGRRPSSHGCVRIRNEDGRRIFANARQGTVVYVHSGSPARVLAFADADDDRLQVIDGVNHDLLDRRLEAIHARRADDPSLEHQLALPAGERLRRGIDVGRIDRKARVQLELPLIRLPDTYPVAVNEVPRPMPDLPE